MAALTGFGVFTGAADSGWAALIAALLVFGLVVAAVVVDAALVAGFSPTLALDFPVFPPRFDLPTVCSLIDVFSREARCLTFALFRQTRSWHKTETEMNASLRLFVIGGHALRTGGLLGCLMVGAGLSGCANPFAPAPLDKASAAAPEIAALAHNNQRFPTFATIPAMPSDVRADRAWGKAAAEIEGQGAEIARATAPGTWTLTNTSAFVKSAQADAGPTISGAESTTADTEAFAKQARARATPPPPPKK